MVDLTVFYCIYHRNILVVDLTVEVHVSIFFWAMYLYVACLTWTLCFTRKPRVLHFL